MRWNVRDAAVNVNMMTILDMVRVVIMSVVGNWIGDLVFIDPVVKSADMGNPADDHVPGLAARARAIRLRADDHTPGIDDRNMCVWAKIEKKKIIIEKLITNQQMNYLKFKTFKNKSLQFNILLRFNWSSMVNVITTCVRFDLSCFHNFLRWKYVKLMRVIYDFGAKLCCGLNLQSGLNVQSSVVSSTTLYSMRLRVPRTSEYGNLLDIFDRLV